MTTPGNPSQPCLAIQESRQLIDEFSSLARAGVDIGLGDPDKTEAAIRQIRGHAAQRIGGACSAICAKENRCIMESAGPDDPLNTTGNRTSLQEIELKANAELAYLRRTVRGSEETDFLVIS